MLATTTSQSQMSIKWTNEKLTYPTRSKCSVATCTILPCIYSKFIHFPFIYAVIMRYMLNLLFSFAFWMLEIEIAYCFYLSGWFQFSVLCGCIATSICIYWHLHCQPTNPSLHVNLPYDYLQWIYLYQKWGSSYFVDPFSLFYSSVM